MEVQALVLYACGEARSCDYKKILWTSEGGNIQALRNMLQMHVGSISITVKALQRYPAAALISGNAVILLVHS